MKKTSEPIVFFGSGPVAAKSLELLVENFEIEMVVTKPRPAHHKGDVPVLTIAQQLGLPIKTAANKKELDKLFEDNPAKSRVGVLIDFGIIVSQKIIDYFPLGIVNSHFSRLPEWRGADPITFAILSGQTKTGVSLMLLVEAMDEGPLLAVAETDIDSKATGPELTDHLIDLSNTLLEEILPEYMTGQTVPSTQESLAATIGYNTTPTYSRKLTKADGILDWSKPADQLEREIRAFIEWPKSRATFDKVDLVVTQARVEDRSGKPGEKTIADKQPAVYCGEKALVIEILKPAGRKEMTGEAFLAGYKKLFL